MTQQTIDRIVGYEYKITSHLGDLVFPAMPPIRTPIQWSGNFLFVGDYMILQNGDKILLSEATKTNLGNEFWVLHYHYEPIALWKRKQ